MCRSDKKKHLTRLSMDARITFTELTNGSTAFMYSLCDAGLTSDDLERTAHDQLTCSFQYKMVIKSRGTG